MKRLVIIFTFLLTCFIMGGCKKDFLDEKPSKDIFLLNNLSDFQSLLDNTYIFGKTGALPQISSDDYYAVSHEVWQSLPTLTEKNAYIWERDLFAGEIEISDWNIPFQAVFYANNVLDGLKRLDRNDSTELKNVLTGSAHFLRAYSYYDLVRNFCKMYDSNTAATDLGLPLRTENGIDVVKQRSSLGDTYDFIFSDLQQARSLLENVSLPVNNRNRPSKAACYALFARIYLSMGNYEKAGLYADSTLQNHSALIDYNTVSRTSTTPFSYVSEEIIYSSTQEIDYGSLTNVGTNTRIAINRDIIDSYSGNDLRLPIFFSRNSLGNYNIKRGYMGGGAYQYSGLATDEMYLIRAECFVRDRKIEEAMQDINTLLRMRFLTGTFAEISASSEEEALNIILMERRKELVWRALRWSDLKRLNKEGRNITLTRNLNGQEYTLPPNDPRYIFHIPADEIALSGIQQNQR